MAIERPSGDSVPKPPEMAKNTKLNITVGIVAFAALALLGGALAAHFGVAHLGFLQGHTIQLISKVFAGVGALSVIARVVHSIWQTRQHKQAIENYEIDLNTHDQQLHENKILLIQSHDFAPAKPLKKVNPTVHSSSLSLKECTASHLLSQINTRVWNKTYTATTQDGALTFSRTGASKAEAKSFNFKIGETQLKLQLFAADTTKLELDSFPKTLERAYQHFYKEATTPQTLVDMVTAVVSKPTPEPDKQQLFEKALAATFAAIGVTDETPLTAIVRLGKTTYLANQGSNQAVVIDYDAKKVYSTAKKEGFSSQTIPTKNLKQCSIILGTKDSWLQPDHVGQPLLNGHHLETVFHANMANMYPGILKQKEQIALPEEHAMMAYSPYPIHIRV